VSIPRSRLESFTKGWSQ